MALWTPAQITTTAWYDADDSGTITEVSGDVSQWDDKSGNANHAVQATGADQPFYSTNEIQIESGEYLECAGVLPTGSGARHLFVVLNDYGASSEIFISQEVTGSWSARKGFRISAEPAVRYNGATTYTDSAYSSADHFISVNYESGDDAADIDYWVDGTQMTFSSGTADVLDTDGTKMYLGADYAASLTDTATIHFKEIIVITNRTMSTSERETIEGYLAHKWGLEGNLPGGHTYKSAAPTVGGIITDLAGMGGGLVGIGGGLVG